jgi:hypothetical protein
LIFLGTCPSAYLVEEWPVEEEEEYVDGGFVLQLAEVAVVDMLVLELLYRVNCDVDEVLIELRQFEDMTELALDPTSRPLRVLFGETARGAFGLYPGDLFS